MLESNSQQIKPNLKSYPTQTTEKQNQSNSKQNNSKKYKSNQIHRMGWIKSS